MGYRNYIAKAPRVIYEAIKDKNEEELCVFFNSSDKHFDWDIIPDFKKLHELGKCCDFNIDSLKEKFFIQEMSWDSDCEFSIAKKELLEELIKDYHKKVKTWYEKSLNKSFEELQKDAKNMFMEWNGSISTPYNMDLETPSIVDSWKYEYEIFELVRIYKTFDWENDVLIYLGS